MSKLFLKHLIRLIVIFIIVEGGLRVDKTAQDEFTQLLFTSFKFNAVIILSL